MFLSILQLLNKDVLKYFGDIYNGRTYVRLRFTNRTYSTLEVNFSSDLDYQFSL